MKKLLVLAVLLVAPTSAHAFCGFYVNGAGGAMFNDATEVVLMRMGTRTVLSMQNSYQGPLSDFAMVVPVPVVLQKDDVKTLDKSVFDAVDTMGSPRLVEYWEQDPCQVQRVYDEPPPSAMMGAGAAPEMAKSEADFGVKIEAKFTVGEYQILILSATESTGLDHWLRDNHYQR